MWYNLPPTMTQQQQISIPTSEELELLFRSGDMESLGEGRRRHCYRIPGHMLCVKAYRRDDELPTSEKASVRREIAKSRFSEKDNTSCKEWMYYQSLKKRLTPDLMSVFPSVLERVPTPTLGWCLVEELICNEDGSPSVSVESEFRRRPWRDGQSFIAKALKAVEALGDELSRHCVRFYDPPNILVQTAKDDTFRLRIADFEPEPRTFISLDALCPLFVRLKVRRRFSRYLKRLDEWRFRA